MNGFTVFTDRTNESRSIDPPVEGWIVLSDRVITASHHGLSI